MSNDLQHLRKSSRSGLVFGGDCPVFAAHFDENRQYGLRGKGMVSDHFIAEYMQKEGC